MSDAGDPDRTRIFRVFDGRVDSSADAYTAEVEIGYVDVEGSIWRIERGQPKLLGKVDDDMRLFRSTAHSEREVGKAMRDGTVFSAGLFEGGVVGWVTDEGIVVQSGLILGEEEVGRVIGARSLEAGAALLLILLPDEREDNRRAHE